MPKMIGNTVPLPLEFIRGTIPVPKIIGAQSPYLLKSHGPDIIVGTAAVTLEIIGGLVPVPKMIRGTFPVPEFIGGTVPVRL